LGKVLLINYRPIKKESNESLFENMHKLAKSIHDFFVKEVGGPLIDILECDIDTSNMSEEEIRKLTDNLLKQLDYKVTIEADAEGNMLIHFRINDDILKEKIEKCKLIKKEYYEDIYYKQIESFP